MEISKNMTPLWTQKTSIRDLLSDIKVTMFDNFSYIYETNKNSVYSNDIPVQSMVSDEFTHFQRSDVHYKMKAIIEEADKLNDNKITNAVRILEDNYVIWKNAFCNRVYHMRSSKVTASASGFLFGSGLLFGSSLIMTGGIIGICGSICLYVWKYEQNNKSEHSYFENFYKSIDYVGKEINKIPDNCYDENDWHMINHNYNMPTSIVTDNNINASINRNRFVIDDNVPVHYNQFIGHIDNTDEHQRRRVVIVTDDDDDASTFRHSRASDDFNFLNSIVDDGNTIASDQDVDMPIGDDFEYFVNLAMSDR